MAAAIALRTGQFRKYAQLKGLKTDAAIAAALKIDAGHLSRVLNGKVPPGAHFIAGTLAAFPMLDFADLFDVVTGDDDIEGAA